MEAQEPHEEYTLHGCDLQPDCAEFSWSRSMCPKNYATYEIDIYYRTLEILA